MTAHGCAYYGHRTTNQLVLAKAFKHRPFTRRMMSKIAAMGGLYRLRVGLMTRRRYYRGKMAYLGK